MPAYTVTKPSWLSTKQELRENGNVIGELTMLRTWSYALAEMRMGERIVRFGYEGWTARNLFIRDQNDKDIATVKSLSWWKHHEIVTIDGKTYEWVVKNWWYSRYAWVDSDGKEVMAFRTYWTSKVDIDAPAPLNETEMLLLFFGLYVIKLQEMETASSGM